MARLEASRQEMAETRDIVDVTVVVVVLCSGAGSGLRLRRENIGRYNGRVAASAVQASVHQLNNPGFLTFLRRLLEIRDKCLVKSNPIYNLQNSANPLAKVTTITHSLFPRRHLCAE